MARKAVEAYEDGDLTAKQVIDLFEHVEELSKRSTRTYSDLRKRFEASAKNDNGK